MSTARQAFHVAVVAYYVVITHWINENMVKHKDDSGLDPVVKDMQMYSLRFLTNWTFTLQTIYFFIALGEEILCLLSGLEKIKRQVNNIKSYIFTVLAAPMALLVSVVFWSMWHVDRELIFPKAMDHVLPAWVNHSLHTTTSVLVLIEMYLSTHKYPTFKSAVWGMLLYLVVYSICFYGTYLESGVWLYPLYKTLNWTFRILFSLAVFLLAVIIYGAGYLLNKVIWGEQALTQKVPKKKHKKH